MKQIQQTEKDFCQQVVNLAHLMKWKVYHTWTSIHSQPGFPDLILLRGRQIIVAELKSEKGSLTISQEEWLAAFRSVGVPVYIWRPSMLKQIEEVLVN